MVIGQHSPHSQRLSLTQLIPTNDSLCQEIRWFTCGVEPDNPRMRGHSDARSRRPWPPRSSVAGWCVVVWSILHWVASLAMLLIVWTLCVRRCLLRWRKGRDDGNSTRVPCQLVPIADQVSLETREEGWNERLLGSIFIYLAM